MFDLHYDLLTQIYINKEEITYLKEYFKEVYNNQNIIGGIFNLFYMLPKEMKEELNIERQEIDLIKNLETVTRLIKEYHLIPKETKYIIGIEGLDYLKNIEDIDKIYELGVRSTNIVWNNNNKFGGGAKGDKKQGLTCIGSELIKKLVQKNIAIDLSHANTKTFYNIINYCKKLKKEGLNPIVFASHSNCKTICNTPRNLTDNQIKEIANLGGVIGIVGIKQFCLLKGKNYKEKYVEHINYVKKLLGGVDNICVSTDNMEYYKIEPEKYKTMNVFNQTRVKEEIQELLIQNKYTKEEIEKILYKNFQTKILQRL